MKANVHNLIRMRFPGVLAFVFMPVITLQAVTELPVVTTSTELNLSGNVAKRQCTTKEDKEGICVSYMACRENYTINIYGNIDDNEVRAGGCPGFFDWCCIYEGPWKENPEVTKSEGCTHATATDCPWCVSLYRNGGNPRTKAASGLFCGGALIGAGLVLTSASCISAARDQRVWARIQGVEYNVTDAVSHPQYDSGTRDFDFAILALSEKIDRDKGACIQLNYPRNGNCRSYSFNERDDIVMTELSIETHRCDATGGEDGALSACGKSKDTSSKCRVALGAPVICTYQDGYGIWGIARSPCGNGQAHIGPLAPAAIWIKSHMAVPPKNGIR